MQKISVSELTRSAASGTQALLSREEIKMNRKTLVITGGARGIGFGIVKQMASEGYNAAVLDICPLEDYYDNYKEIDSLGAEYLYIQGDVSVREDRERFLAAAIERFGSIDLLVNNAGVAPLIRQDILEMTEESFDRVMGTNLKGAMFFTQSAVKHMLKQEYKGKLRGTIVNICSSSAYISSISRGEYCMSKAAMAMMTKLYADRLAAEGINVYEIQLYRSACAGRYVLQVVAADDAVLREGVSAPGYLDAVFPCNVYYL